MKYWKHILIITLLCLSLAACQKECDHEYGSSVTLAPTCTQVGTKTFACVHCGDCYTEEIPIVDHHFGESVVELEATCAQEGHTVATCAACGQTQQTIIPKLPHTMSDPVITQEPTCTDEGVQTGICGICGAEGITEPVPIDSTAHSYEGVITLEATCTAQGTQKMTCTRCGAIEDQTVSALGHKWTGANCQTAGTCSRCNATGALGNHDYEILSTKGDPDSQYYAQEISKRCKICGLEKTTYKKDKTEFDLEAIEAVLAEYAAGYGFGSIIHTIDETIISSQRTYKAFDAFKVSWYKDPIEEVIKLGKQQIDLHYNNVKNLSYPMSNRQIQIDVRYGASGSIGGGFFYVYVARTTLT